MSSNDICEPIKTFEELLTYSEIKTERNDFHVFRKNPVSYFHQKFDCHEDEKDFQPRMKRKTEMVPKTLVCHDMKGGYLHDRYINGCGDGNGYTFYRWQNIDIFVYFSHYFVTIPPPGWINLAHKHDVKILGTFITEFDNGIELCKKIFRNEDTWRTVAKALINICLEFNFDGWLLNIENRIDDTTPLLGFVSYLTNEMHTVNKEFTVLWYDSVTKDGKLKWQNELNENNMCYFDICDGIFLNYTWNTDNLLMSAQNARDRILDVFVGIDVFGRNCFGGGGFKCNLAAKEIRGFGLSMAIFAQGWTHETLHPRTLDAFYEIFLHRDNAFWLLLYPYLYTRPITNEFTTTFYTGADRTNYNLNLQEILIHSPVHSGQTYFRDHCQNFCQCIQLYLEGCKPNRFSYLITTSFLEMSKDYVHRLFACDINICRNLEIQTVTKEGKKQNNLLLFVLMEESSRCFRTFQVESKKTTETLEEFRGIHKGWQIRKFTINIDHPMKVVEIGMKLDCKPILLGGFSLKYDCVSSTDQQS